MKDKKIVLIFEFIKSLKKGDGVYNDVISDFVKILRYNFIKKDC